MTRETDPNNTYIGDFQNTGGIVDLPETDGTILVSEVDDQIRDAKQMIFNTFKSCNGEVTADHTELSYTDATEQNLALWTKGQSATGLAIATGDGLTPNTYTLTTGLSHTLADGDAFTFQCSETSTGASLLQVDSNTARNLVDKDGANIAAGDISANSVVEVRYDASAQKFYVIGGITAGGGTVVPTSAFYTAGSYLFTAPVTGAYTFEMIGGGGAGGFGGAAASAAGGGGGGYLTFVLNLTAGDQLLINPGDGGRGRDGTGVGEDGKRSEVIVLPAYDIYFANPGSGGEDFDTGGQGGAGGVSGGTEGTGPFEPITGNDGGAGANGTAGVGSRGGGGGSGGGSSGNGLTGGPFANGADGSGGATGGAIPSGVGGDADIPSLGNVESGGGGGGGDGQGTEWGGHGGLYGSGGGGSGDSGSVRYSGNGQTGVVFVSWA